MLLGLSLNILSASSNGWKSKFEDIKMQPRYYITNQISVDSRFMIKLADNGPQDRNDDVVTLYAAPSIELPGHLVVFMRTSGDPSYVATFDAHNAMIHFEDSDGEGWVENHLGCQILSEFSFKPDADEIGYGADEWLRGKMCEAGMHLD